MTQKRGVVAPLCASSSIDQLCHHSVEFDAVQLGGSPRITIGRLAHSTGVHLVGKITIGAATTNDVASGVVESFVVSNPESDIPSLNVGPAVVGVVGRWCPLVDELIMARPKGKYNRLCASSSSVTLENVV